MNEDKTIVKNWVADGNGYIFMFAKDREAIGVKVDLTKGVIKADEHDKLRQVSDRIIEGGLAEIGIKSGELVPISREDYLSEKYTHPADALFEKLHDMQSSQTSSGNSEQ